jgi:hypothetical protein
MKVKKQRSQSEALKFPGLPLAQIDRRAFVFTHNSGGGDGGGGSAQI